MRVIQSISFSSWIISTSSHKPFQFMIKCIESVPLAPSSAIRGQQLSQVKTQYTLLRSIFQNLLLKVYFPCPHAGHLRHNWELNRLRWRKDTYLPAKLTTWSHFSTNVFHWTSSGTRYSNIQNPSPSFIANLVKDNLTSQYGSDMLCCSLIVPRKQKRWCPVFKGSVPFSFINSVTIKKNNNNSSGNIKALMQCQITRFTLSLKRGCWILNKAATKILSAPS